MTYSLRSVSFIIVLGLLAVGPVRAQTGPSASTQTLPPAAVGTVQPDSVYINPEVRPQFVGGDKALSAYLRKFIHYPEQALQRHISGRVYVSFILSAQGRVQDAHVMRGPGNGLNDEALRLVWLMPLWEPGRVNGQPVRVACTIPISFSSER